MASITATLGTLAAAVVIGHSSHGRPIELIHVPGTGPRVLVVGCIHGNEQAGIAVVDALERVAHPHEDLWLVPDLNPDGVAANTRQNGRGVDLNRNFDSQWQPNGRAWDTFYPGPRPFSEPESRLARALILRIHPRDTIWYHQHEDLISTYGRSIAAGRRYALLSSMRLKIEPWLHGTASNWQNHLPDGETSIVVELPAGSLDAAGLRRHVRAALRFALAAA